MTNNQLLNILVCPLCKGNLVYVKENQELICLADGLSYAIKDGIPVMLPDEARELSVQEVDEIRIEHHL